MFIWHGELRQAEYCVGTASSYLLHVKTTVLKCTDNFCMQCELGDIVVWVWVA